MSIITKRGDHGETDLLFGKRAAKTSPRIGALGALDELNAHLGVVKAICGDDPLAEWIDGVQKTLVSLMGMVATEPADFDTYLAKGYGLVTATHTEELEERASQQEASGNTFKGWLKPGDHGSLVTAHLHLCRTVCRRAERTCWEVELANDEPRLYLNRLSDVLWLMTSHLEKTASEH